MDTIQFQQLGNETGHSVNILSNATRRLAAFDHHLSFCRTDFFLQGDILYRTIHTSLELGRI
jgi:hypothetical protein